ncbi:MAG TPA: hypothetical protein GX004_08895 [Firmicutes bacterium]|nr:hypothetical protein [Bacillota bacterium]
MSKFLETEFVSTKEVLKFPDHYVALAVMVDDADVQANEDGKKIVPKGTIVGGKSSPVLANLNEPVVEKHADPAVKAGLTTGEDNDVDLNNEIVWEAVTAGHIGNLITVTLVDPDKASESLSITVTGFDIVVSLATGADKAITSTPATIVSAVNADTSAKLLVLAAGTGTDPVEAVSKTYLSGGADPQTTGAEGVLLNDVDVTHGPKEGAMLVHGFVAVDKLPYSTGNAAVAAAAGLVLPMIKFIK